MTSNGNSRDPKLPVEIKDDRSSTTTVKKRRCATFCDHFGDYSKNTTIHGIKYLGEQRRPIAEKIWWLIGFLICAMGLGYFIYTIVVKWQKTPVIVSTDDTKTPIFDVPFPAVTLCPETKMRSQLFNYTDTLNKLIEHSKLSMKKRASNTSIKYFEAMLHICDSQHFQSTDQLLWKGKQFMDKSYVQTIQILAPNYDELFVECKWGKETDCKKIFIPIITEEGQCYTLNLINEIFRKSEVQNDYQYFKSNRTIKHWNFDTGYTSGAIDDAYPVRAMAMGQQHGLTFMLKNYDSDINYVCRDGDQGYKISLHNPTEFPQPYKNFVRVPHGQYAQFAITPKIVKTAPNIDSYSPERRQCFFNHERRLKYFNTYNEMNCKLECVANLTYAACGCIKFSLPRGRGIPICGVQEIECYSPIWIESENDVLYKQFTDKYYGKNESDKIDSVDDCNCLPECTLVHYTEKHEFTKYNFKKVLQEADPDLLETIDDESSRRDYIITEIDIFFASTSFYGETRSELYGISDLVSNFGGLLGLFMGGSILSLIELLYFCTIRNLTNSRRKALENGSDDD